MALVPVVTAKGKMGLAVSSQSPDLSDLSVMKGERLEETEGQWWHIM